jgi:ribosome biogenesis GTPase
VNALLGAQVQHTTEVRTGDQRGRHTTVAAELLALPGEGWLVDTPGVRAMSLWLSGEGIERAFADVFASLERLDAEEPALEAEQRAKHKAADRRRGGRPITTAEESADAEADDDDE